jgi:hypothetical protein
VKLTDFGLVRLMQQGAPRLTGTGQVVGTLAYMAPEQLERPREVDHRADVYALGVVLYEMLTGELPRGHFDPPSKKCGDERLDPVVLKALAPDPARRHQTVAELKGDLEKLQQAGIAWRQQDTPFEKDLVSFIGWALVPLALALYALYDTGRVLPWWLLAAVPCVATAGGYRDWKSAWLRRATFTTWFLLLPAYTVLGQALGWEAVFGGTHWQWLFGTGIVVLAFFAIGDWPRVLKAANRRRELTGQPPLRPFQPFVPQAEASSGCGAWALVFCGVFCVGLLLPGQIAYWLPTFITLWVAVHVGWVTFLRSWLRGRLKAAGLGE